LDGLLGPQDDLPSIACVQARDFDALCQDVASIIFRPAVHTPSVTTTALRAALSNPHHTGPHLFVAHLSADLNIGHDHILRLIDFESVTPMIDLRSQKLSSQSLFLSFRKA
jgi:hypothetical protein